MVLSQGRHGLLQHWAGQQLIRLGLGPLRGDIVPVSGDASFRRYYRGVVADRSVVLVDAPPDKEDSRPFIEIDRRLSAAGVRVPHLLAVDVEQGFMCLEDFGDRLLWPALEHARIDSAYQQAGQLYQRCFASLLQIQQADARTPPLPLYDEALLLREMRLFSEWFCRGLLQHVLTGSEQALVESAFTQLCQSALQQKQVFVHRDYHSRNLMLLAADAIGIIDFQDAVLGPVTYDLVSLLKDCYIEWPEAQVREWALEFAGQAQARDLLPSMPARQFLRDFGLMGMQRHIKVLGIFSRLWLRDGKSGYLGDIPLTFRYLLQAAQAEPSMTVFAQWLADRIQPQLAVALDQAQTAAARKEAVS